MDDHDRLRAIVRYHPGFMRALTALRQVDYPRHQASKRYAERWPGVQIIVD